MALHSCEECGAQIVRPPGLRGAYPRTCPDGQGCSGVELVGGRWIVVRGIRRWVSDADRKPRERRRQPEPREVWMRTRGRCWVPLGDGRSLCGLQLEICVEHAGVRALSIRPRLVSRTPVRIAPECLSPLGSGRGVLPRFTNR